MSKMQIFEPAMCCSTGLCGVGVDTELLRISTVLNELKSKDIVVDRFNLSDAPMEFINNTKVNDLLNNEGMEGLPLVVFEGEIVINGRYPSNEEFEKMLAVTIDKSEEKSVCDCGGCCC